MRNNKDRIQGPQISPNFSQPVASFICPTFFVDLPSQGKFYNEKHPLFGKKIVEVKEMTTAEEDILSNQSYIKNGVVFDKFRRSVLIDKTIDPGTLLACDQDEILIRSRISGYGPEYELSNLICEKCKTTQTYSFDANNFCFDIEEESDSISSTTGTFSLFLPRIKVDLVLKVLTVADIDKLNKIKKAKVDKGIPETNKTDELMEMIVSVNGNESKEYCRDFIQNILKPIDSKYINAQYKLLIPKLNTEQTFICKSCAHTNTIEVPVTVKFFWPY